MRIEKVIDIYLKQKRKLVPLDMKGIIRGVQNIKAAGKKALHKNFLNREYSREEILGYASKGHNIGFVLGTDDLVIDVDPRNGGDDSFDLLCDDLGVVSLSEIAPTVMSGRKDGGRHYYFKLPKGLDPKRLSSSVKRYEGLDFLHKGKLVVIPGSTHVEAGGVYDFDEISPFRDPAPLLPKKILKRIKKKKHREQGISTNPDLTPKQLRQLLSQLEVTDYRDHDRWFQLAQACHYATGGKGVDVFLDWSTEDPVYVNDRELILYRWNSIRDDADELVTTGTLLKAVRDSGGTIPDSIPTKMVDAYFQFGEYINSDGKKVKGKKEKKREPELTIREQIDKLSYASTSKDINAILKRLNTVNIVQANIAIRDIAKATGLSKRDLKKQCQAIEKETGEKTEKDFEDAVEKIAKRTLRKRYRGKRGLLYGKDDEFWFYNRTHWELYTGGLLSRDIMEVARDFKAKFELDVPVSQVLSPAEKVIKAITAENVNLSVQSTVDPVINCSNGELWIEKTGTLKLKKHTQKHYLTSCLDRVKYNRKAKCPVFKQTLKELFRPLDDCDEVVRHFFEFMGYMIQPNKNIASWWLLYGKGANGKTVVLKVISALLGSAVLERPITDFDKDNHAFATLPGKLAVIDEDVKNGIMLPDSFLKKVSESKTLFGNPKHSMGDQFTSNACVIMACNELPKFRDLSDGLKRRAMFFPFLRRFRRSEQDLNRAQRIIDTELSGVLNEALEGLKRLRQRGTFDVPGSCRNMVKKWLTEGNPLADFVETILEKKKGGRVELKEMWIKYDSWCAENEVSVDFRLKPRTFAKRMREHGFETFRSTGGKVVFEGVSFREKKNKKKKAMLKELSEMGL